MPRWSPDQRRGEKECQWTVAEGRPRAHVGADPVDPPKVRPAARKLLLNGVKAGIMEREATKSRWSRLDSPHLSRVKGRKEALSLLVDG